MKVVVILLLVVLCKANQERNRVRIFKKNSKGVCAKIGGAVTKFNSICTFYKAKYENDESQQSIQLCNDTKEQKNFQNLKVICASDNVTYSTMKNITDAVLCNKMKIVHEGNCGECERESVCPQLVEKENKIAERLIKKKGKRYAQRKTWSKFNKKRKNNDRFESWCEFRMRKCETFKYEGKIIKKQVWKKKQGNKVKKQKLRIKHARINKKKQQKKERKWKKDE